MESIEQMTQRLCPNGVPMVKIGDVCKCYAGGTPDTKNSQYWENGTIQWMSSGEVNKGQVFATEKKITQLGYDKSSTKMVPINSVVIALAGQGKTRGTVAITRTELCTNQSLCAIIPNDQLIPDFLFHYLKGQYQTLRTISCGDGNRGGLNLKMINAFEIPLPPMEIQNRIVEILDKMTTLTAELEAELEARKQQYEYYRNKLLSFNELSGGIRQVTWKKLRDVLYSIRTGLNPRKFFSLNTPDASNYYVTIKEFKGGRLVFSNNTDMINDEAMRLCNNRSNLEEGDLLFSGTGTIGEVLVVKEKPLNWNIKEGVYALKPKSEQIMVEYLKHIMQTSMVKVKIGSLSEGGTVKSISMKKLADFVIPVPSMAEQERIVSILDRFEALTTDLQIGLPAEIEARRQQYEYYRNKLLTFKQTA